MATRLVIGWDTEYQEVDPEGLGRPNPARFKGAPKRLGHRTKEWLARQKFNEVLAYSVCVLDPETGEYTSSALAATSVSRDGLSEFADYRKRLSLFRLVGAAIAGAVGAGIAPRDSESYQVTLAAHFSAADLPGLRDFEDLTQSRKRYIHTIRKTYTTLDKPIKRTVRIPGVGHRVPVSIRFVDTMLWSPATHRSIAKIGGTLGLPKIELPKGAVSNMRDLKMSDPGLFERYAIRDAEVAALYAHQFLTACRETFGLGTKVPVTASGAGVAYFKNTLTAAGYTTACLTGADEDGNVTGRANDVAHIASECFHGGRNETFWVGPTPKGVPLYDLDLAGCYPACMALIRVPDFEAREFTTDLQRLAVIDDALTFARVSFEFPESVRFPCLPVRAEDGAGLFYPRTGVSWCTGPELVAAVNLGASVDVEHGVHVPWLNDYHPFLDVLARLQAIRTAEVDAGRKGSLNERLAKEMANSLYGQTARAVAGMRMHGTPAKGFDLYDGSRPDLPPSSVSSPACAAFVTGMARATVSELINSLPDDAVVVSVTTDGFLSSVPLEDIDTSLPLITAFTRGRRAIVPGDAPLEEKHRADRAFSLRTRGVLTIDGDRTREPLLARAGNRMDEDDLITLFETGVEDLERKWAENDYWLEKATTRQYGDKVKRSRLTSIAEQWASRGGDLTRREMEVSVAMEFDHKRHIHDPVVEWKGAFGAPTKPWETIKEATACRTRFAAWRHEERRVLKTVEDLEDFRDTVAGVKPKGTKGRGAKTPARLDALRHAAANGLHGLPSINGRGGDVGKARRWTQAGIAAVLTEAGFPTNKQQIRYWRGARTVPPREEPRPEDLETLKAVVAEKEGEMTEKAKSVLGIFDSKGGPERKNKNPDYDNENKGLSGTEAKAEIALYREGNFCLCSDLEITRREVRIAADDLGVSRLKLDRATTRLAKRLNGDAPQDKTGMMLRALALEAFGPVPNGPELVRELIVENRGVDR